MQTTNIFKGKKVLFFSPKFFGYGVEIAKKLEILGCDVDYFDEKPNNDFITKALVRVNKKILSRKIYDYYSLIFKDLNKDVYDIVFFLTPESISVKSLKHLKSIQPNAKFVLYMWDSLKNRQNVLDLLPFFDYKFSFDKQDCNQLENNFNFRPLFYLDIYKNITYNKSTIDLFFVGTVHSDRLRLLKEIENECKKLAKRSFYFMFLQSKIIYYYRKLTDKHFRKSNIQDFAFKSLSQKELIKKLAVSNSVLDIQHPLQSGLTMRAIEMIGAKKKLITTNRDIANYDFFNSNNILIIDRNKPKLKSSFFESKYVDLEENIYFKYSIEGWLEEIFSESLKITIKN
tara:strand:- start:1773 stop:2801 length:1029 start_codon:yes stop_codon:yes gene_type:complete